MNRGTTSPGFTLIELVVVVAILGILAAIGVPMVSGYIQNSKNAAVESGLRSIYLAEQDYKREEGTYYTGNGTAVINSKLFSGKEILNQSEHTFSIRPTQNGFQALGFVNGSNCQISITHLNKITRSSECN